MKRSEYCNECCEYVYLEDNELKLHRCPKCGRYMTPCSICPAMDMEKEESDAYCGHCCLRELANQWNREMADKGRERIKALLETYTNIPIARESVVFTGANGLGFVLGISLDKNGEYVVGYDVKGYLFNETFKVLDDELVLDVIDYLDKHESEIKWEKRNEYQVIIYLKPDIVDYITADDEEDARKKMFEKFKNMSNEEIFSHLDTSIREVACYKIWDEGGKQVAEGYDTTL